MRFGSSFRYDVPVLSSGPYFVQLIFKEPNKTAAGQRVFTVDINGQTSPPIDVFAAAGINTAYTLPAWAWATWPMLHIQFTATTGNAIVSEIRISAISLVNPFVVTAWETCANPPTPTTDCSGIERLTIQKADGTTTQRFAYPYSAQNVTWKAASP